ncbi:hypothetical protein BGW36DRAFT_433886 [Talaromyces proteolyticus]|uniref:Uncharacterized protein n=1 Tax=Talaromyces proteolyticus TaxID=1131652 RepID=A0AAD4KDG8_9EURO|nr:uncharacterized protein BGW36DRAFT_433886 [Talaromyces proteolyticus]KAH8689122.1 hypothetical protein BGW36DRAFT_433886 [Talaromyces proteolyticus]
MATFLYLVLAPTWQKRHVMELPWGNPPDCDYILKEELADLFHEKNPTEYDYSRFFGDNTWCPDRVMLRQGIRLGLHLSRNGIIHVDDEVDSPLKSAEANPKHVFPEDPALHERSRDGVPTIGFNSQQQMEGKTIWLRCGVLCVEHPFPDTPNDVQGSSDEKPIYTISTKSSTDDIVTIRCKKGTIYMVIPSGIHHKTLLAWLRYTMLRLYGSPSTHNWIWEEDGKPSAYVAYLEIRLPIFTSVDVEEENASRTTSESAESFVIRKGDFCFLYQLFWEYFCIKRGLVTSTMGWSTAEWARVQRGILRTWSPSTVAKRYRNGDLHLSDYTDITVDDRTVRRKFSIVVPGQNLSQDHAQIVN